MQLLTPKPEHLDSYIAALANGWSTDSARGQQAAVEEMQNINADPNAFLAYMEDREGRGPAIKLPDGSEVKRLPGITRWIWDGAFCGRIDLRWQDGTTALPPHCLGHIGYSVVPWKQRQGYATQALHDLLHEQFVQPPQFGSKPGLRCRIHRPQSDV